MFRRLSADDRSEWAMDDHRCQSVDRWVPAGCILADGSARTQPGTRRGHVSVVRCSSPRKHDSLRLSRVFVQAIERTTLRWEPAPPLTSVRV